MNKLVRLCSIMSILCLNMLVHTDTYSDRLARIVNTIASEYDASSKYIDKENITAAGLQATNFIIVENNISKNSPLGIKNKYITTHAETLQKKIVELFKEIQKSDNQIENMKKNPKVKQSVIDIFWNIKLKLEQLEGEIAEIPKKQFLPLTKVQKDLVNLLELLVQKNLAYVKNIMSNIENNY